MSVNDVEVRKFRSQNDIVLANFAPGATAPTAILDPRTASEFFDIKDFQGMAVSILRTVGVGALTSLRFDCSKLPDGSSPQTVRTIDLTGVNPDAVGDLLNFEMDVQDIQQAIADLGLLGPSGVNQYRYLAPVLELAVSTDEYATSIVRTRPDQGSEDLSPNIIA